MMLRKMVRRYRQWRFSKALEGPRVLKAFEEAYPSAFFVQIGANDGKQLDPLRQTILRSQWKGVMVEPVPYIFKRLLKNYQALDSRIQFINAAIAETDGNLPFFYLQKSENYRAEGLPFWYDQIGSFRKEILLKHIDEIPDIDDRIVQTNLECLSFESLCRQANTADVDILHTDVEGYDFKLLQSINLKRFRPKLIIYEHYHLTCREKDDCVDYLAQFGYDTMQEGMDTWCLRLDDIPDEKKSLIKSWQKAKSVQ